MTLFLKSKIRKQIKKIRFHEKEYYKAVNKYNELVAEYQGMNVFAPITMQQQNPNPTPEKQQPEVMIL